VLGACLMGVVACRSGETEGGGQSTPAASRTVGSSPSAPESQLIELDDFYFEPKEIDGKVGETLAVTGFGEGQQTHTLTIDALGVDRELKPSDTQEVSLPLQKAGSSKCTGVNGFVSGSWRGQGGTALSSTAGLHPLMRRRPSRMARSGAPAGEASPFNTSRKAFISNSRSTVILFG